jgi:glycosyltransferase involved in cell wall biosynthesis
MSSPFDPSPSRAAPRLIGREASGRPSAAVTLVHPCDPWAQGIGGFDTVVDGLLRTLPREWPVEVVGVSAHPASRPVRRRLVLDFAGRPLTFVAALAEREPDRPRLVPLSLRFALACRACRLRAAGRVVQYLRFESCYAVPREERQRSSLFLFNDVGERLRPPRDVRWRFAPALYRILLRRTLARSDVVFASAPATYDRLPSVVPAVAGRLRHIREWVDRRVFFPAAPAERRREREALRRELDLPPQARIVVSAGRLEVHKGHLLLLEAFAALCRDDENVVLLIVGKGRLLDDLRRGVARLGVAQRVRLHPAVPRDRLAAMLRGSDLGVCASEREAGPRFVFEALACGLPVVSTDVGQARAAFAVAGSAGVMVDRRTPGALSAAITVLLRRTERLEPVAIGEAVLAAFSLEASLGPVIEECRSQLDEAFLPV